MIRPLATVSAGTLGSRLSGFLRDALIAALFGAGFVADAFLLAFQFVNVARRLLSEGALNAMLVPAYLRVRNAQGDAAAAALAGRALGTIGAAVLAAALLLAVAAPGVITALAPGFAGGPAFPLAIDTLRLMLPYLAFVGPVAVMAAVLNAQGRVALTSLSPLLFNAAMIAAAAALLIVDLQSASAALALAAVVGATGCAQLVFLGLSGTRHARPVSLSLDPEIRRLLHRALPGMIAQSGLQLFLVAGAVTASASPSAVSFIYFASRLIDLPLGLVGAATGAVLIPKLSVAGEERLSSSALQLTLGLALPAAIGLALLAELIVATLFERGAFSAADTQATARALALLAAALPALALTKPMSAIFFAREQTAQPLAATLAGLAIAVIVATLAQPAYGFAGVAAAISLAAWVTAIWLGIALNARGDLRMDTGGWRTIALVLVASAAMAFALVAALKIAPSPGTHFWARAAALGTLIAFGLLVYAAALRLFGVVNFRVVRRAF